VNPVAQEDVAMLQALHGAKVKWGMPSKDGELDKKMKKYIDL